MNVLDIRQTIVTPNYLFGNLEDFLADGDDNLLNVFNLVRLYRFDVYHLQYQSTSVSWLRVAV
jgi:hypothetical protein